MTTDQTFDQALKAIAGDIETIGDRIQEQVSGQTDQGAPIEGYACQRGTHQYTIVGSPVWEFFRIGYEYDAIQDEAVAVAAREAIEAGETGEVDIEITETMLQDARQRLVDRSDADTGTDLRLELIKWLSQPDCALDLRTDDQNRPLGFELTRKLFVYDGGVTPTALNRAVQTVVSLGLTGSQIMSERLGIEEIESTTPEMVDNKETGTRMFQ
ncbi:MAG: hypothetical protein ABEH65_04645 [Halobacteriales archaeon]